MSQINIYKFLKKEYPRWFTAIELAIELNIMKGSSTTNLRRLRGTNLLNYRTRITGRKLGRTLSLEYQYKKC